MFLLLVAKCKASSQLLSTESLEDGDALQSTVDVPAIETG